jgi:hypothetical protein
VSEIEESTVFMDDFLSALMTLHCREGATDGAVETSEGAIDGISENTFVEIVEG